MERILVPKNDLKRLEIIGWLAGIKDVVFSFDEITTISKDLYINPSNPSFNEDSVEDGFFCFPSIGMTVQPLDIPLFISTFAKRIKTDVDGIDHKKIATNSYLIIHPKMGMNILLDSRKETVFISQPEEGFLKEIRSEEAQRKIKAISRYPAKPKLFWKSKSLGSRIMPIKTVDGSEIYLDEDTLKDFSLLESKTNKVRGISIIDTLASIQTAASYSW